MASGHEEIDPIKSNPNSHKAIGVVLMLTILVGLAYWLRGSPFSNCPVNCDAGMPSQPESCCPEPEKN